MEIFIHIRRILKAQESKWLVFKIASIFALVLSLIFPVIQANADDQILLRTAAEYVGGYDRNLFKHWIDADKNAIPVKRF